MHFSILSFLGLLNWTACCVGAVEVTWTDDESIKSAASTVAYGLVKYYTGNNTGDVPGNLPDPYYWWHAGAMFGVLVNYWAITGDDTYNQITYQALTHQVGDDYDYMPKNQTKSEGNDDQGFWAMAAMFAAETNFTNPTTGAGWLALAQAVYNEYVERWNEADDVCGGGLRWQIYTFNNGWNYKNSVANGCFFSLAARLTRYTGNTTYAEWATKIFEWQMNVNYIDKDWAVLDGAGCEGTSNCTEINQAQFTYNAGLFVYGAAVMYSTTEGAEQAVWKNRTAGLVGHIATYFFRDGVMWEPACETTPAGCNTDQESFKGHLVTWLALTTTVAPFTADTLKPLLASTAKAAALQCDGTAAGFKGPPGTACGFGWLDNQPFDGLVGVGQQMNALQAIMAPLVEASEAPLTEDTGGSSEGDPNAGASDDGKIEKPRPITTSDRAGAGMLTALVLGGLAFGIYFVSAGDGE
ncbi:mannan endo-1,6-alpha-mannosidase DCW1 [Xylariomycetidae sp. FL0641]|nr:mannan endo-1,6-alpha-mannosidase DCW1 [Xylariomycetidae sp. FL0641]